MEREKMTAGCAVEYQYVNMGKGNPNVKNVAVLLIASIQNSKHIVKNVEAALCVNTEDPNHDVRNV
jgi:hypothetical protein